MEDKIDLSKLTPELIKERNDFLNSFKDEGPKQYYVTCSGTIAPFPSKAEDWETARANGEFIVDGAEIISDDD